MGQLILYLTWGALYSPYGSAHGSKEKTKNQPSEKVIINKENPLISTEIRGFVVAGAGFEPTTFGL